MVFILAGVLGFIWSVIVFLLWTAAIWRHWYLRRHLIRARYVVSICVLACCLSSATCVVILFNQPATMPEDRLALRIGLVWLFAFIGVSDLLLIGLLSRFRHID